jgi:hypothetical protein
VRVAYERRGLRTHQKDPPPAPIGAALRQAIETAAEAAWRVTEDDPARGMPWLVLRNGFRRRALWRLSLQDILGCRDLMQIGPARHPAELPHLPPAGFAPEQAIEIRLNSIGHNSKPTRGIAWWHLQTMLGRKAYKWECPELGEQYVELGRGKNKPYIRSERGRRPGIVNWRPMTGQQ